MSYIQPMASTQRVTPLTGTTVNVNQTGAPLNLIIVPAGTLAALSVNLPPGAYDGQTMVIFTTALLTLLTVATTSGTIVGSAVTTLPANGSLRYVWNWATSTWYKLL